MPQLQLPLFPEGVTHLTPELAFVKKDGRVTYFTGICRYHPRRARPAHLQDDYQPVYRQRECKAGTDCAGIRIAVYNREAVYKAVP